MSQTTYNLKPAVAFAGMAPDSDITSKFDASFVNAEGDDIPFGIAMARGDAGDEAVLVTSPADEIVCVARHTHAVDIVDLDGEDGVADEGMFSGRKKGRLYVKVEEAVAVGDQAFVRFANGVADAARVQKGAFRKSDDTGTAFRLKGGTYQSAASADGFAILEFDVAIHNKHDRVTMTRDHAENADGGAQTTFLADLPEDAFFVVDEVKYNNVTGLAAHNDNHALIQLKNGATVLAGWNTDGNGTTNGIGATAAAEGSIAADTPVNLTLNTLANRVCAPGARLDLVVTEAGTTTVPAGTAVVHGHYV
jgi:hypothetical protein